MSEGVPLRPKLNYTAMRKFFALSVVAIVAMAVSACSPSMRITGNWINKEVLPGKKYKKVFLFPLTSDMNAKQTIENSQAVAASDHGFQVVKSSEVLTPDFMKSKPTKEAVHAKIKATGCDAIFTSALIDSKADTRYVPGTTAYAPFPAYGYYGNFAGYYGMYDPFMYDPGYYVTDKTYFIESNLYDVASGAIVWSVQSEAYNPKNLKKFSDEYALLLIDKLQQEGLLPKK